MLGINCSAAVMGIPGEVSNNYITTHEGVDIAMLGGWGAESAGGMVRSVNESRTHLYGVTLDTDRGDIWAGGSQPPTLIRIDNTAACYADRCRLKGPPSQYARIGTGAVKLRRTQVAPFRVKGAILS